MTDDFEQVCEDLDVGHKIFTMLNLNAHFEEYREII